MIKVKVLGNCGIGATRILGRRVHNRLRPIIIYFFSIIVILLLANNFLNFLLIHGLFLLILIIAHVLIVVFRQRVLKFFEMSVDLLLLALSQELFAFLWVILEIRVD